MIKVPAFKIRLLETATPLDLKSGKELLTISGLKSWNPVRFDIVEADPFLFVFDNKLFLFYESVIWGKNGVIKMIWTKDLIHWSKPQIVLEEECHLSYPFVFFDDLTRKVYMIPETCSLKEIRVYEAEGDDLNSFSYFTTLLKDEDEDCEVSFSDSSLLKSSGKYFLHTTRMKNGVNHLELYISESIFGPYFPHPSSPVQQNNKFGRNGGSLFTYNNKVYRPAMDCTENYGGNLSLFLVEQISSDSYVEEMIDDDILSSAGDFYKEGGHHLNVVSFKDRIIVSTDAREEKYFIIRRILDKIKALIK